jgi:hypothetical protein
MGKTSARIVIIVYHETNRKYPSSLASPDPPDPDTQGMDMARLFDPCFLFPPFLSQIPDVNRLRNSYSISQHDLSITIIRPRMRMIADK